MRSIYLNITSQLLATYRKFAYLPNELYLWPNLRKFMVKKAMNKLPVYLELWQA